MSNRNECLYLLNTQGNVYVQETQFRKKFPEIYQEIISLFFPENFKWSQKLYHFFHDDIELKLGLCPVCGNRCHFLSFGLGYRKHCCRKCVRQDEEIEAKTKQTCLERYGETSYCKTEQFKNTLKSINQSKYGCDYIVESDEFKKKSKQTCLEKYGEDNYAKTQECKEKMKQTCLEKYGEEHYNKTDESKERHRQTCLEKYGVPYYSQSDTRKKKCQEKYGAEHYSRTHECATRRKKRVEYGGLTFDSSWEVIVYKFCHENNIPCVYQPDVQLTYVCDGIEHVYQPDFLINNQLYEVKGDQFFEGDKMINPYDRSQDPLFESKHQCMIQNGVIILRGEQINNLSQYIPIP